MAAPNPIKPSHRGLLHERLGIPKGEKISLSKLMSAKRRDKGSPGKEKQDVYAINARSWAH